MTPLYVETLVVHDHHDGGVQVKCQRCGRTLTFNAGHKVTPMATAQLLRFAADHPTREACK